MAFWEGGIQIAAESRSLKKGVTASEFASIEICR